MGLLVFGTEREERRGREGERRREKELHISKCLSIVCIVYM